MASEMIESMRQTMNVASRQLGEPHVVDHSL